jgi:mannose-6-phosphate isomerase
LDIARAVSAIPNYPLRFHPRLRRYLWGGRRLGELLRKPIGPEADYAESWEICDRGDDQSVVAFGPLAEHSLGTLVRSQAAALLGRHHGESSFPLLLKYLDAAQTLSVQVHPNDAQARRLAPPDRGKTEAWVVLEADDASLIYAGLKPGVDRRALGDAIRQGRCDECLASFHPHVGDCLFIPAGTVHALGAGLLVAEIQQSSDTTYRLFDWNRLGPDGQPRTLHIDEALAVIDYSRGPVPPQTPCPADQAGRQQLVNCDAFVLDRLTSAGGFVLGGDDRCHLVTVIDGALRATGDATAEPLQRGDTMLLPAAAGAVRCESTGSCTVLDSYLP